MVEPEKILKELTDGNSIYGDIFTEEREYTRIHLESSRFEKIEKGIDRGVGLRTISPWKTFFASTNSFDEKHLREIARELKRFLKKNRNVNIPGDFKVISPGYGFKIHVDPYDIELGTKLNMLKRIEDMARAADKRIKQVRVLYLDTKQKVHIYTSEGIFATDERKQVVLNMTVIGEEKGEMQTAYESIGGFYGFDYFSDERIEDFVKKVTERLKGLFKAKEAPMGIKTVVLSKEAGGTMIHEAIGHGLEADLAMEGLSCYKDMLGEKIASDLISVVDDKTLPHMRGSYACDDEGVISERTVLVEKGILKNYLFDKFHAMKFGKKSTANGRRESYRFKPIPRMSNTMI
ncbi:MAG TPA: TldD/PmbA family protein, partial [Syntrophorhabdaceae bacterium]|nr:TldD/PmbA family protein [Syntrophorhabdaceae bacterium]